MTKLAIRTGLPMGSKPAQYDYIVLDGSGSMQSHWWDMLDAIDAYVETIRMQQLNTHIKLSVFDSNDLNFVQRDCNINDWVTMRDDPALAYWGTTPLYDAIIAAGLHLREVQPVKASIAFVTDGEASRSDTTIDQARAVINWMKAQGWAVTFIGCDWNNSKQAKLLGVGEGNTIAVAKAHLTDATSALARKRTAYGHGADDITFDGEEKQKFGGYLAAK